jgi:hypothetical protein|tara:strand:- start:40528 stop:40689 length:162 start_codon:yes stop_codon:yes gene_type:complete
LTEHLLLIESDFHEERKKDEVYKNRITCAALGFGFNGSALANLVFRKRQPDLT